jgi:hypothetical protein
MIRRGNRRHSVPPLTNVVHDVAAPQRDVEKEPSRRNALVVFRCDLTASDANRWLEIPAWMFDRSACAEVRLAVEPHTNLSALVMLGAAGHQQVANLRLLLRDVRNKRTTMGIGNVSESAILALIFRSVGSPVQQIRRDVHL